MNDPQDWTTPQFRNKVVMQIEENLRISGNPIQKSGRELEGQMYEKAKCREEYLALVARLILHVKHINKNEKQPMLTGMNQVSGSRGPQQQIAPQDPMNALASMTHPGSTSHLTRTPMMQQQMHRKAMQQMQQQAHQAAMAQQQSGISPQGIRPDSFMATSPAQQLGQIQQSVSQQGFSGQPGTMIPRGATPFMPTLQQAYQAATPTGASPNSLQGQALTPTSLPTPQHVPSPSAPFNAAGSSSIGASPAGARDPSEDAVYLEKLKQLSVWIEPLRKTITSLQREEGKKLEVVKMNNLLEILCDSSKRLSLATLMKCEQFLQRMNFFTPATPTTTATTIPEQHMCQPLLDAVSGCLKSPFPNHALHQTFRGVLTTIHGPNIRYPGNLAKQPEDETVESPPQVADVIQGEVARLGVRFRVCLDRAHEVTGSSLHFICHLNDPHLPTVPFIYLTIPGNYPQSSPYCNLDDYDSSVFLQSVKRTYQTYINHLPDRFSITSLLHAWEMSVRQTFAPVQSAPA